MKRVFHSFLEVFYRNRYTENYVQKSDIILERYGYFMISLQIKVTKNMMNALLASECFDTFLLEEAAVTTFNTFHIDGRVVKDFYTAEELSEISFEFSLWKDIRPFCFQLIKGKKTPVSFKVVLHAPNALVEKIAATH